MRNRINQQGILKSFLYRWVLNSELTTRSDMGFLNRLIFPLFFATVPFAIYKCENPLFLVILYSLQTMLNIGSNMLIIRSKSICIQACLNAGRNIFANVLFYFIYTQVTDPTILLFIPLPGLMANSFIINKPVSLFFIISLFILPFVFLQDIQLFFIMQAIALIYSIAITSYFFSNFLQKEIRMARAANESKSIFLAHMSHEIRTPMNGVLGMTDILLREETDETRRMHLNIIKQSGKSLVSILNDILDISKLQSSQYQLQAEEFDLRKVLISCHELFYPQAFNKNLDLILYYPFHLNGNVIGDPYRFRQIVLNLVGNALKFTEQGFILIKLEELSASKKDTAWFSLDVIDTGIGIKTDQLESIFEEFNQGEETFTRKYGGSGLGLSISRLLVEKMGGTIDVKSVEGSGSKFSAHIPFLRDKSSSSLQTDPIEEKMATIIVDSSAYKFNIFFDDFMSWNPRNRFFISTHEALDHIEKNPDDFYLILIDEKDLEPDALPLFHPHPVVLIKQPISETTIDRSNFFDILHHPVIPEKMIDVMVRFWNRSSHDVSSQDRDEKIGPSDPSPGIGIKPLLLADDDPINLMILEKIITELGYSFESVKDGQEAIDLAAEKQFGALLFDIEMPQKDGMVALAEIKKSLSNYQNTPAFACTAHALSENLYRFKEAGFHEVITKPYSIEEISQILKKYLSSNIQG